MEVTENSRKINYKLFYEELGKLLYAIAKSDGTIQPKEIQTLREIVKKELAPLEDSVDEYGTEKAFYTDFMFEIEDEQYASVAGAFNSFIEFMKENEVAFDEELRAVCLRAVEELADAYRGINKKELPLIEEFKKEQHKLAIARKLKILIPTDFSASSMVAVNYAEKLFNEIDAEIILLHAAQVNLTDDTALLGKEVVDVVMKNAEDNLKRLSNQIRRNLKTKKRKNEVSYKIIAGYNISQVVEDYAGENKVDLIIMGTKGAKGIEELIIGTHTADVIEHSSIPMIAVSEKAAFTKPLKIMYATDMEEPDNELETLITYAKPLNAIIHVVHFYPEQMFPEKIDSEEMLDRWVKQNHYDKIMFDTIMESDTEEGIENFIKEHGINMLAMFTHKRNFFQRIIHKSLTKKMAFHSQVPLFIFKKIID